MSQHSETMPNNLFRSLLLHPEIQGMRALFDARFYRETYHPDEKYNDLFEHYLFNVRKNKLDPAACFSETYYLARYKDVAEAVKNGSFICGFHHFVVCGRDEGRLPLRSANTVDLLGRNSAGFVGNDTNTEYFEHSIDYPPVMNGIAIHPVIGALNIRGWLASPTRVERIDVSIDGVYSGVARYGLYREDVKIAHPDWQDAEWSGFEHLLLLQQILPGSHVVSLSALNSVGSRNEVRFVILVKQHLTEDVLSSEFLDKRTLYEQFGIRCHEVTEFESVYWTIPAEQRPSLSPFFDRNWYFSKYKEVNASGVDAFQHFCVSGFASGYSPHPLIDLRYIIDLRETSTEAGFSLAKFRMFLEKNEGPFSPYFDLDYYLDKRPEACDWPTGALGHFLECSTVDLLIPNKFFDADFYMDRYHDVPQSAREAFLHFVSEGDAQFRFPSLAFDPEWYLQRNEDVRRAGVPPLQHFLQFGQKEGRAPRARQVVVGLADLGNGAAAARLEAFSPDIIGGRERYISLRKAIDDRRAARLQAVAETESRVAIIDNVDAAIEGLQFAEADKPKVSILIPFFNEIRLTVECLISIALSKTTAPFEIILADDCSTDPAWEKLSNIPGVRFCRQNSNLNFLKNCNAAFHEARGEYVFLLNNDAQVLEGAIDRLARALDEDETLGAVGPQLLFPSGRLQEAGCAVRRDASSVMVGVHESPSQPCYQFARDVDYISGAALMFRRSLAREELFDTRFAPAYCEDLDLCLEILAKGLRIRYVPDARVVHHLSMTMSDHGRKMMRIRTNQHKVLEKWGDTLATMNRVRVIAFYLPQFHPIAENDLWWGKGFTEWTNVSKAQPSYAGHYQPRLPSDLGFYDLRLPETLRRQAELLHKYDLGGLCFYYYNFGGRRFLGRPLELLLENPDIDLPFCLCWANENWSRRWDGGSRDLLMEQLYDEATLTALARDVALAARDPRYIRVDGRPVFLLYRPLIVPDVASAVQLIRDVARAEGCGEMQMVFVESMEAVNENVDPLALGFDAAVEFPPQGFAAPMQDSPEILKEGWEGHRYDYEGTVQSFVFRPGVAWPRYPAVFPSWDNTPRQPLKATSFDRCSPEAFQVYGEEKLEECRALLRGDNRLLFVNAWNEWAEGACLEPDRAYGHRWLEALRTAMLKTGCV